MGNNFYQNNSYDSHGNYCQQIFEAENIIWMSTYITLCFARELTIEQMDIWGNIFSAVGSNLSALAVLYPTVPQYSDENNRNTNQT